MTATREIAFVYVFESGSRPGKFYQTLQYTDRSTSCDCPAWIKRCNNGQRTCRHTRSVETGMADRECKSCHQFKTSPGYKIPWTDAPQPQQLGPELTPTRRLIRLED